MLVQFNSKESAFQFARNSRRSARAKEGIKHEISYPAAGEKKLGKKLFRLLRWMVGIFGHGPKRYGQVSPEVGRVREAEISVLGFLPVLWLPVHAIRRNDTAFEFHRFNVETIIA